MHNGQAPSRVEGLGFRVQGFGFRVEGLGFRVFGPKPLNPKRRELWHFGLRVQGEGRRIRGLYLMLGYLRLQG